MIGFWNPLPPAEGTLREKTPPMTALDYAKQFAGGVWEAKLDKAIARLRFKVIMNGNAIESTGVVYIPPAKDAKPGTPSKTILMMLTRYGYDPVEKSTYVLDIHNHDTVYLGHARVEGKVFVNDFTRQVGGPGHWIERTTLTDKDTMESVLYSIDEKSKQTEVERFTFKRVAK